MRKLLISLIGIASSSFALANVLDNGTYNGYLQQVGYQTDKASGAVLNDQVDISIPILSSLNAVSGKLTGTIIATTDSSQNCISNPSFSAKLGSITVTASDLVLNNCKYDNGTFTGSYNAVVLGQYKIVGNFSFTKD